MLSKFLCCLVAQNKCPLLGICSYPQTRVVAVAQPVVIIDAHTAECLESLRYDRRNRDGAYRRFSRIGRTEWQSACERRCSSSREAKREKPSSGRPAHENLGTPGRLQIGVEYGV